MSQWAAVSATTGGDARHEPLTPTMRAILLTLPIQACTMFGSLFPPWALAIPGIAMNMSTAVTVENFIVPPTECRRCRQSRVLHDALESVACMEIAQAASLTGQPG
jgi:hypothetical protein